MVKETSDLQLRRSNDNTDNSPKIYWFITLVTTTLSIFQLVDLLDFLLQCSFLSLCFESFHKPCQKCHQRGQPNYASIVKRTSQGFLDLRSKRDHLFCILMQLCSGSSTLSFFSCTRLNGFFGLFFVKIVVL